MVAEKSRFKVFLPLTAEEDLSEELNLIPAIFPPNLTTLRRIFVCRPLRAEIYLPEMSYALPEVLQLDLEAQMAASHSSRQAVVPLVERGFAVESEVLRGTPIPEIMREISLWAPDMAIVRARRADARDDRLGGMASALLEQATCPVLTHRAVAKDFRIRRVLIATDFSSAARNAADWGMVLAEALGAQAHLLHVLPQGRRGFSVEALSSAANEEISRWRGRIDARFDRPLTDAHVTTARTPAEGILQFAIDQEIDLTVISATGRSAAWSVLMGSTARTVARMSERPVLVLPTGNRVSAEVVKEKFAKS